MRWLILCLNLIGLRNAQRVGKTLFLGMSVRMFPEEISIWISRLSKEDAFTNSDGHHPSEGLNRTKGRGKADLLFA